MPPLPELSLFARLTKGRRRVARAPEPADLGTAFGMEQWLSTPGVQADAGLGLGAPPSSVKPGRKRSRWLPSSGPR